MFHKQRTDRTRLIIILLTWRIWWAPNNASKWQMEFNAVLKELESGEPKHRSKPFTIVTKHSANKAKILIINHNSSVTQTALECV